MTIPLVWLTGDALNIRIIQGADWHFDINYSSTDLSGASVAAKVRELFADASPYTTLTATVTSTGAGTSSIRISLTDTETAALDVPTGASDPNARDVEIGPWDYEVTDSGGVVTRPVKRGTAYLNQEATK